MTHATELDPKPSFRELDVVSTQSTLSIAGHIYPSGSTGTIVHVYGDGRAFEVEFAEPAPAVATLEIGDVKALVWRG